MANKIYNKQVSPKGYQTGGRVAKMGGGMMMNRPMMNKGGRTKVMTDAQKEAAKRTGAKVKKVAKQIGKIVIPGAAAAEVVKKGVKKFHEGAKKATIKSLKEGRRDRTTIEPIPRQGKKIGGFLKKVGKKVGKAAAGVGAAVLAAKALKKKKPKGKKMDAVDKYFAKKGTTLKTGSAIAAETMAKADRDKKKFREGLDKIAKAGGVSKLKDGGSPLKPVNPETQKGLSKLPTKVRNKMGFMKKGGKV
jgi:hypothetical protein